MSDSSSFLPPWSAFVVTTNDDILIQILLKLPIKTLMRFKCVSKHWLSLITRFSTRNKLIAASGLILRRSSIFVEFVSLNPEDPIEPPFKQINFAHDPSGIRIIQSCNGLLLCSSFRDHISKRRYYVYNPTTKQFRILPENQVSEFKVIRCVRLAFDPQISQFYKVVCVRASDDSSYPGHNQIEIYSSENKQWRTSSARFQTDPGMDYQNTGVYWIGKIHWLNGKNSLTFDVDQEKFENFAIPLGLEESRIAYFGESCDHLYIVYVFTRQPTRFDVYEMEKHNINWSLKYQVDLQPVVKAFPGTIRNFLEQTDFYYYAILLLSLVHGEGNEEPFLLLHVPGKILRYNLTSQTFIKLGEFYPIHPPIQEEDHYNVTLDFDSRNTFQYIESFSCV